MSDDGASIASSEDSNASIEEISFSQKVASIIKPYLAVINSILARLWAFVFRHLRTAYSILRRRLRRIHRRVRILRAALDKAPLDYADEAFERSWPTRFHSETNSKYPQLPYKPPPPPGMVRVRWFPYIEAVLPGRHDQPDLYADVVLEENGDLDLRILKRLWGLENCIPVDWVRLKLFYPGDPDRLSHVAVQLLSADHDRCLRIIEKPSEERLEGRELRESVQDGVESFREYWREERRVISEPHFLRDTALGVCAWVLLFVALSPALRVLAAAALIVGTAVFSTMGAVVCAVGAVGAAVVGVVGLVKSAVVGMFIAAKFAVVNWIVGIVAAILHVPKAMYAEAVDAVMLRVEAVWMAADTVSQPVVLGVRMVREGWAAAGKVRSLFKVKV